MNVRMNHHPLVDYESLGRKALLSIPRPVARRPAVT